MAQQGAGTGATGDRGPIVVGIDGSEPSIRALRWASGEARARDVALELVTCWSYPALVAPYPFQPPLSADELEDGARQVLKGATDDALGSGSPGVRWSGTVRQGSPSLVLLELAATASMVVVGSRGRGGFRGLMLGSVSQHLAEHARCPVVVVH